MAKSSSKVICVFLILSLALPNTLATDYVVGDALGWALGANVLASLPQIIHVGDTLLFRFTSPQTVAVVDLIGYLTCDATLALLNDVSGIFSYTFTKPGTFWFISAGPGACAAGLKLQVLVL
ncbi:hypothetical protein CDL12_19874 [Handroanthus impetiginosus]|uniref:Phytocyanin domain-containing protein n=1 Tax=Handroanthus impetiginosus TaxID=429701 RepID=A0A2G9GQQ1_9LAMI|nr:hypothetical protein CDL12_19874 [Handroanthus impetiginosus]